MVSGFWKILLVVITILGASLSLVDERREHCSAQNEICVSSDRSIGEERIREYSARKADGNLISTELRTHRRGNSQELRSQKQRFENRDSRRSDIPERQNRDLENRIEEFRNRRTDRRQERLILDRRPSRDFGQEDKIFRQENRETFIESRQERVVRRQEVRERRNVKDIEIQRRDQPISRVSRLHRVIERQVTDKENRARIERRIRDSSRQSGRARQNDEVGISKSRTTAEGKERNIENRVNLADRGHARLTRDERTQRERENTRSSRHHESSIRTIRAERQTLEFREEKPENLLIDSARRNAEVDNTRQNRVIRDVREDQREQNVRRQSTERDNRIRFSQTEADQNRRAERKEKLSRHIETEARSPNDNISERRTFNHRRIRLERQNTITRNQIDRQENSIRTETRIKTSNHQNEEPEKHISTERRTAEVPQERLEHISVHRPLVEYKNQLKFKNEKSIMAHVIQAALIAAIIFKFLSNNKAYEKKSAIWSSDKIFATAKNLIAF